MATRTNTKLTGGSVMSPKSLGITMQTSEYPNGVISLNLASTGPYWYIPSGGTAGTEYNYNLWLTDSAGNNGVYLTTLKLKTTTKEYWALAVSHNLSTKARGLEGKALYFTVKTYTSGAPNAALYVPANSYATVTVNTAIKPSVSVGDYINKTDMDALKTYLDQGTSVSVGGDITATIGNTYKSGATVGSDVTASWFNT